MGSKPSDNLLAAAMHSKKYSINSSQLREVAKHHPQHNSNEQANAQSGSQSTKRVMRPVIPKPKGPKSGDPQLQSQTDMVLSQNSAFHTHQRNALSTVSSLGSKQPAERRFQDSKHSSTGTSGRRSLLDIVNASVIMIQKVIRGFLCRRNLGRLFRSVLMSSEHRELFEDSLNEGTSRDLDSHPQRDDVVKPQIANRYKDSHSAQRKPDQLIKPTEVKPNFKKDKDRAAEQSPFYDQGDSKYYYDLGLKEQKKVHPNNGSRELFGSQDPELSENQLNDAAGSNTFSDSSSFNQRVDNQETPRERSMLEMRKTQKKDYRDYTDSKSKDKSQKVNHYDGKILVDEFQRAEQLFVSELPDQDSPILSESARERVKMRKTDQGTSFQKQLHQSDHKLKFKKPKTGASPTDLDKVNQKGSDPDINIDFNYEKHSSKTKKITPSSGSCDEKAEPVNPELLTNKATNMVSVATQMSKKQLPQVEVGVVTESPDDSDYRRLGDVLAGGILNREGLPQPTKHVESKSQDQSKTTQTKPTTNAPILPQIRSNRRLSEASIEVLGQASGPKFQEAAAGSPLLQKHYSQTKSKALLDTLAKEQYMNWSQVDKLLSNMNAIPYGSGSNEVSEIFRILKEITNDNKSNLKTRFALDPTLSQVHTEALSSVTDKHLQDPSNPANYSQVRSDRLRSDQSSKNNPQGIGMYTFSGEVKNGSSAAPNSLFQNADQLPSNILKKSQDSSSGGFSNSPLNISYTGSQSNKMVLKGSKEGITEIWPENIWVQGQSSVDSKHDPNKLSDHKKFAFGLRGFPRDELSLSESVIRSSVAERETNQFNDFAIAERNHTKEMLVRGSPKATGLYGRPNIHPDPYSAVSGQGSRIPLVNSPKTPIGNDDIIFESLLANQIAKKGREVPSRFENETDEISSLVGPPKLLQKTRSKKSIPRLVPLDELPDSNRDELSQSRLEDEVQLTAHMNPQLMKTYADWRAGSNSLKPRAADQDQTSQQSGLGVNSKSKESPTGLNIQKTTQDSKNGSSAGVTGQTSSFSTKNATSVPRASPKEDPTHPISNTPLMLKPCPRIPPSLTIWQSVPETAYVARKSQPKAPQLPDSNRSQGLVLQEANLALQSILDDINSFVEIEEVFIDSGRRDRGESRIWNDLEKSVSAEHSQIKYNIAPGPGSPILYPRDESRAAGATPPQKQGPTSPGFSAHAEKAKELSKPVVDQKLPQTATELVDSITERVLESIVAEIMEEEAYSSLVHKTSKARDGEAARETQQLTDKSKVGLEDQFSKIDEELLAYDEIPRSSNRSGKNKEVPAVQGSRQSTNGSNGSIPENTAETGPPLISPKNPQVSATQNLETLLDDLPDLEDMPPHESDTKTRPRKEDPKKVAEDKHEYSGEDEQSDAETVYGLRTNFNAVSEYLLILMKFLKDRQGELGLPPTKDSPEVVLLKAHLLEHELKEYKNNDTKVVNVQIPPKTKKGYSESRALCFKRNTEPGSFLQAQHFLVLEEEILSSYKDMNIMEDLVDMQRVYHRAIFDCFNEGLTESIFSSLGTFEDLLNKEHLKKSNKNSKDAASTENPVKREAWLEKAKDHVLESITILAGLIRDKEDSLMGTIKYMDDENIQQLREDRMYRMITAANQEREKEWGSKPHYELVIKLELSEKIFDQLVTEAARDLQAIFDRRTLTAFP